MKAITMPTGTSDGAKTTLPSRSAVRTRMLPVIAEKLNFDPAVMASPLITTIVDTTTLLVYFNIARVLLRI